MNFKILSGHNHYLPTVSHMRLALSALSVVSSLTLCPASLSYAQAPDFPNRPLTLVVPFPPGGAADIVGRVIARGMEKQLKQTVVVENKAGAGTAIGAAFVANAKPDGYTLLSSSSTTYVLNPALKSQLTYDPIKSFESLGLSGSLSLVLIANSSFPANSLKELLALAKSNPGKYQYASFGVGTSSHFTAELIKNVADVDLTHVAYRGSAPAMQDLIGGQIPLSVDTNVATVPQLKAGKIKAFAIASPQRSKVLPDVPTFVELGYPQAVLEAWNSVVTTKGTPPAVLAKLSKAFADTMKDPETQAQLEKLGLEVRYEPPAVYTQKIQRELPLMRALVHRAKITPE